MSQKVRVRFAPSPTGPLHIGGVRTALFNYLFAKKHGGDFLLRIEDTDQNRYVEGAEEYIIEALNWLNIPYDEGIGKEKDCAPYRQSERKDLYKQYADALIESGNAYYAFDTSEELDAHRKDHEEKGKTFIYNWHNRLKLKNSLVFSSEETRQKIANGEEYVIRFKSPVNETLHLNDIIRGGIQVETSVLDDKVLFKSDGMPTYHLANIVDDHLMKITHVIRGEEWLPSMALHVLLYRAFRWDAPEFAHLPLILKPTGNGKLSKRDGDKMGFPVFPLEWKTAEGELFSGYREDGYLPEAVINMLAFLGWNPGTEQEIFSLEELIEAFELERVHKAGAKFDPEKTKWFQHQYIQNVDNETLAGKFSKLLKKKGISTKPVLSADEGLDVTHIVSLLKERATFVSDLWEQGSFFFEAPNTYDAKAAEKAFKPETPELLLKVISILNTSEDFSIEKLSEAVKGWITSENIGFGKVMMPLRLALVGEMKGPDVFDILSILGKEESNTRIKNAVNYMS
ncbi:glutamyl-tRNA synthetase [Aequorivita sublithincola DSM 14238]|uniref:Glutamate--tRNA ligase n=1 Tax=Aequorivita sublithincola (strain DSM 14238 / LMG 21431 / ACAM 643 / 9-3) TaxID=746697 RepID=I3YUQ3_AEQSU|nr:glutamate--tRNA ligase [Aequorivita sublithincola]AFL80721.1 glutamyl-tRNA synthetase [Aequorivita sublithincola DSM 14238]